MSAVGNPEAKSAAKLGPVNTAVLFDAISRIEVGPKPVDTSKPLQHANRAWRHDAEGPDDMPAHVKSALTQTSLSIPVRDGQPALGTWQGIYLFEHRDRPHRREIAMHLIGA